MVNTMLSIVIFLLGLLVWSPTLAAFEPEGSDTTIVTKTESLIRWRLTTRLHSKGMFMYAGQLGSDNPTFDVNFTLEYKKWGLLIFKGLDLQDHETDYNFALLSVFRNLKLSDKITFTPYVGTFLEQPNHFADEGSDAVCILITTIKLGPLVTFEHMALFGSLVFQTENLDWANRFRLTYSAKHIDIVASIWHNNIVFDNSSYATSGLNVAYGRMKVAKHIFLSAGVTGMATLYTSDEEKNPSANRVMFTLAAQWFH